MQVALDLVIVCARRAALGVRQILAVDGGDLAVQILFETDALDHEAVAETRHVAEVEPVITRRRRFHKVFALDPQFATERDRAFAEFGLERMVRCKTFFALAHRVIDDDQLERVEHSDTAFA